MSEGEDSALIARLTEVLRDQPGLGLAILFGSAARGGRRSESDVDIAIAPDGGQLPDAQELDLVRALTLTAGAEIDLVPLDRASTLLKWQIATTGVPLLERWPVPSPAFAPKPHPNTSSSRQPWPITARSSGGG